MFALFTLTVERVYRTYAIVPMWRNGRRRGFKIPRPRGRAGSSPAMGTNILRVFFAVNFVLELKGAVLFLIKYKMLYRDICRVVLTVCYYANSFYRTLLHLAPHKR